MNQQFLNCGYGSVCSGCDWLLKPYSEQVAAKIAHLNQSLGDGSWPTVEFVEIALGGLRDRVDLMIDQRSGQYRLGLFDRFRSGIVDLQGCPQMSPGLEAWFQEFRKSVRLPIERGSVRLRVSPAGSLPSLLSGPRPQLRGVWLDLANIDVKRLLDERTQLLGLLELGAIVEIGQRRKRLVIREGQLKLGDPVLEPWFETELTEGRTQSLYCAIGSFTQPGLQANRALIEAVLSEVRPLKASRVIEFGSGLGNFTLPLAATHESVAAYEVDELALEGLRRSLNESGLASRVEIHSGNYQIERKAPVDYRGYDLVFVDPPRSGLMKFLDPLEALDASERPTHFVYVSCFAESFAVDARRLLGMGYEARSLKIVDQFPQSRHYEVVARFSR